MNGPCKSEEDISSSMPTGVIVIVPNSIGSSKDDLIDDKNGDEGVDKIQEKVKLQEATSGQTKVEMVKQNGEQKIINGKPAKITQKEMKGCKRFWGLSLGILSSFCFSMGTLCVKLLSHHHPFSIAIWRFQGILLPSLLIILHTTFVKKDNVLRALHPVWKPEKLKIVSILVLRGMAGCSSAILFNYAMNYMSMPDATVIVFSTPVFVTFLAHIFLKEQCGLLNILSALVTMAGVIVIIRPPFLTGGAEMDTNLLIGAGMALASMSGATVVFLCLRILKGVNYSVVTFSFGVFGTFQSACLALSIGEFKAPDTAWDWLLACGLALSMFCGQVTSTLATKYEEAGVVALTRTFDVPFSFIWQLIFLGVTPTIFSLLGSIIVMAGISIVFLQKYLQNLPKDSAIREFCGGVLK